MPSLIHVDRRRGSSCVRGPHSSPRHLRQGACGPQPRHVGADYLAPTFSGANNGRDTMGMYCLRALIPVHTAGAGEIMEILWSDYYGAVLFGEGREIACIPHKGGRHEAYRTVSPWASAQKSRRTT